MKALVLSWYSRYSGLVSTMVRSRRVTPETFRSRKVMVIGLTIVQREPGVARVTRKMPHHMRHSPK
jgi:hypothetical protein